MNTNRLAWRQKPITVEQWKVNCKSSSHVRKSDKLSFKEDTQRGVISCHIEGTAVFLGAYYTKGDKRDGILDGTGWNHE